MKAANINNINKIALWIANQSAFQKKVFFLDIYSYKNSITL